MKRAVLLLAIGSLIACAPPAQQPPTPSEIDKMHGPAETSRQTGSWESDTSQNPVDDSTTVTALLEAQTGRSKFGKKIRLLLRCKSHKTEAYIDWDAYLGMDATLVTTRIGKHKAVQSEWQISTDYQATFYPGGGAGFIRQLLGQDRLVVELTPYGDSPVTAIFMLDGIDQVVEPIKKECGWK